MPVGREIRRWFMGAALVFAAAACGPAPAIETLSASGRQAPAAVSATPMAQPASIVMWGRVPYCNCLADTATANVASALQAANLPVNLQELSPRDGWLYFAVTFDPQTTTEKEVRAAMIAGGAEVLTGPP